MYPLLFSVGPMLRVAFPILVGLATISALAGATLGLQDLPECPRWRRAFAAMPNATLVIHTSAGQRIQISAKVARTDEARQAGFQCATPEEIRTTVIVFDFHGEIVGGVHMKNVAAPLDIAFAKKSGRISSMLRMDPSPTARYGPMRSYRYAIEARAGFFKERGISPGDEIVLRESR